MFEILELPEQPVGRLRPLLIHGTYCLAGLAFVILGLRRHGLSQPAQPALSCGMFSLSLMWFAGTVTSGPPLTGRKVRFRNMMSLVILFGT
jgi:hypothetical protein